MNARSTSQVLVLSTLPEGTVSVDVKFDNERIWSIDVRDIATPCEIDWPEALVPHLRGSTRLSVHDSSTGAEISAAVVAFDSAPHRTSVVDTEGLPLVVNKWGRLGVALEAMGSDVQGRIIERASRIVSELESLGLRPFVVGGTLLGAVRTGHLLPHDDDADLAYLSHYTHPADVAIEAFRVGRELSRLGYEVKRHSATHMQLLFRDENGEVAYYVDVFAAFFSADGLINQPFHVRGVMRTDQMLPFGEVLIDGIAFPAPADPGHWLTINYDEHWRTPIPGYVLQTPEATRRRFDGWFGSFNFHREFWDEFYSTRGGPQSERLEHSWETSRDWLTDSSATFQSPTLVDLGCGSGSLTRRLQAQRSDRRAIGVDYSSEALLRARGFQPISDQPEYAHVNLYRARSLAAPAELGISGPFDIVANHLFEQIGHHGRGYAWRLMRMALRAGGNAAFTFHERHSRSVSFDDPTGWHLDRDWLISEAAEYGLRLEFGSIIEPLPAVPDGVADTMPLARAETFRRLSRAPTGVRVREVTARASCARTRETTNGDSR